MVCTDLCLPDELPKIRLTVAAGAAVLEACSGLRVWLDGLIREPNLSRGPLNGEGLLPHLEVTKRLCSNSAEDVRGYTLFAGPGSPRGLEENGARGLGLKSSREESLPYLDSVV